MQLSKKAKNRVYLVALLVLVGISHEMSYQDAVRSEQAAKELRAEQAAKWTTYQISR
jgi:hypothetical protein